MSISMPSRVASTLMSSTPHSQQATLASPQPSHQQQHIAGQQPATSIATAQHLNMGYANQPHMHNSGSIMSTQNVLFNNAALMGFSGAPTGDQGSMDQMLFRDMNFAVGNSTGVSGEGLDQADVFASLGSSMLGGAPFTSNTPSSTGFPFADLSQTASLYNTQLRTGDGSRGPGGSSTVAPTETFTTPPMFTNHTAMFDLENNHHAQHQQHAQPFPDSGFDPAAAASLFSGIDQDAMNALLYGSAGAPVTSSEGGGGIPQMNFSPQGMQQQQQQPMQANFAAAMYAAAASASSRKRVQRDWDESA
ncbi:hypothetical protein BX666DRAFT_1942031 [Dichotomocladium elegans]|nr:hypothetical protein BX666DRAFT_1942031 [Dichotomocladium elegans]